MNRKQRAVFIANRLQEMLQYYQIFQLKLVEQQLTDTVHQVYKLLQWLLTRLPVVFQTASWQEE